MTIQDGWLLLQSVAPRPGHHDYIVTTANLFLLFFIMLGPIKIIGPFFAATHELDRSKVRSLAWKVFIVGTIALLLAGVVGSSLMRKWHIDVPVMQLAAGLVFLIVALKLVLQQYEQPQAHEPPPAPGKTPSLAMHLTFPVTITPYGIAALIVFMTMSGDLVRSLSVFGMAFVVMVLNLLAMLGARAIMRWIGQIPLQILGAVLGILQVALALQFIVEAIKSLRWIQG